MGSDFFISSELKAFLYLKIIQDSMFFVQLVPVYLWN